MYFHLNFLEFKEWETHDWNENIKNIDSYDIPVIDMHRVHWFVINDRISLVLKYTSD